MLAPITSQRVKRAEDLHGDRGFVTVPFERGLPTPESNGAPGLYGGTFEFTDGLESRRPFNLIQAGDGGWTMLAGWVEGLPVTGTGGPVTLPAPGGSIWVRAEIGFEFGSYSYSHAPDTITSYFKAGPFTVQSAALLFLGPGEPDPVNVLSSVPTADPETDLRTVDVFHKKVCDITAAGVPQTPQSTRNFLRLNAGLNDLTTL